MNLIVVISAVGALGVLFGLAGVLRRWGVHVEDGNHPRLDRFFKTAIVVMFVVFGGTMIAGTLRLFIRLQDRIADAERWLAGDAMGEGCREDDTLAAANERAQGPRVCADRRRLHLVHGPVETGLSRSARSRRQA